MNLRNTLIQVSEDCPVKKGTIPPEEGKGGTGVAFVYYDELSKNPYKYRVIELYKRVFYERLKKPEAKIFDYKIERNTLCKDFGWGIHINGDEKLAIFGCETDEYKKLMNNVLVRKVSAFKKHRY